MINRWVHRWVHMGGTGSLGQDLRPGGPQIGMITAGQTCQCTTLW